MRNDAERGAVLAQLSEADALALGPTGKALVATCRRLLAALDAAEDARADATELAEMRFEHNTRLAKENRKLIAERLELCNALERHERALRSMRTSA